MISMVEKLSQRQEAVRTFKKMEDILTAGITRLKFVQSNEPDMVEVRSGMGVIGNTLSEVRDLSPLSAWHELIGKRDTHLKVNPKYSGMDTKTLQSQKTIIDAIESSTELDGEEKYAALINVRANQLHSLYEVYREVASDPSKLSKLSETIKEMRSIVKFHAPIEARRHLRQ